MIRLLLALYLVLALVIGGALLVSNQLHSHPVQFVSASGVETPELPAVAPDDATPSPEAPAAQIVVPVVPLVPVVVPAAPQAAIHTATAPRTEPTPCYRTLWFTAPFTSRYHTYVRSESVVALECSPIIANGVLSWTTVSDVIPASAPVSFSPPGPVGPVNPASSARVATFPTPAPVVVVKLMPVPGPAPYSNDDDESVPAATTTLGPPVMGPIGCCLNPPSSASSARVA